MISRSAGEPETKLWNIPRAKRSTSDLFLHFLQAYEESVNLATGHLGSWKKETAKHLSDKKVTTYPITTDIFHWIRQDGWRGVLWDRFIA